MTMKVLNHCYNLQLVLQELMVLGVQECNQRVGVVFADTCMWIVEAVGLHVDSGSSQWSFTMGDGRLPLSCVFWSRDSKKRSKTSVLLSPPFLTIGWRRRWIGVVSLN